MGAEYGSEGFFREMDGVGVGVGWGDGRGKNGRGKATGLPVAFSPLGLQRDGRSSPGTAPFLFSPPPFLFPPPPPPSPRI